MYVPISRNSIGKILIGKNRPSIGAITKPPVTTRSKQNQTTKLFARLISRKYFGPADLQLSRLTRI